MIEHIYISIPRTGTNSIHSVLGQVENENHRSIRTIERKGFSFGFVRNPFDLLVSWFQYHRQFQKQYTQYHDDFLTWINKGCPCHWPVDLMEWKGITHPLNQWEYLCNLDGEIIVDFVGRYERLQQHFIHVSDVIGNENKALPHINAAKHQEWKSYYTPKALALVKTQFEKDFKIFNYQ